MRRIAMLCLVLGLLVSVGCSMYDTMFGLFGSHYSNGATSEDRQINFDRQVESCTQAQAADEIR